VFDDNDKNEALKGNLSFVKLVLITLSLAASESLPTVQ
jgi:hypothetical protein